MKLIKKILLIIGSILLIQILIAVIFGYTLMGQWGYSFGFIEGFLSSYSLELLVLVFIVFLIKFFQKKKKK